MPTECRHLRILLVSGNPRRADRIRELMEKYGVDGELHRVPFGRKAINQVRGQSNYRDAPRHDLVMLDFADADERHLHAIAEIAFQRRNKQAPVVLLTSAESEALLSSGTFSDVVADLFAPLGLFEFLARIREHGSERCLRAIRIIAKLGPVLVRLPGFVAACGKERNDAENRRAVECRVA